MALVGGTTQTDENLQFDPAVAASESNSFYSEAARGLFSATGQEPDDATDLRRFTSAPVITATAAAAPLQPNLRQFAKGHDIHTALIWEFSSPLIFDTSTAYEDDDDFEFSDTYAVDNNDPHSYNFSPGRFQHTASLQEVVDLVNETRRGEMARFQLETMSAIAANAPSYAVASDDNDDDDDNTDATITELTKELRVVAPLFQRLDPNRAADTVAYDPSLSLLTNIKQQRPVDLSTATTTRYGQLESLADFQFSYACVLQSQLTIDEIEGYALAEAQVVADKNTSSTAIENLRRKTAQRERKILVTKTLADIELALSESDPSIEGVGLLRLDKQRGAFYGRRGLVRYSFNKFLNQAEFEERILPQLRLDYHSSKQPLETPAKIQGRFIEKNAENQQLLAAKLKRLQEQADDEALDEDEDEEKAFNETEAATTDLDADELEIERRLVAGEEVPLTKEERKEEDEGSDVEDLIDFEEKDLEALALELSNKTQRMSDEEEEETIAYFWGLQSVHGNVVAVDQRPYELYAAIQTKMTAEDANELTWKTVAKEIVQLAIFYKLIPLLYTPKFDATASEWLLSTIELLRAYLDFKARASDEPIDLQAQFSTIFWLSFDDTLTQQLEADVDENESIQKVIQALKNPVSLEGADYFPAQARYQNDPQSLYETLEWFVDTKRWPAVRKGIDDIPTEWEKAKISARLSSDNSTGWLFLHSDELIVRVQRLLSPKERNALESINLPLPGINTAKITALLRWIVDQELFDVTDDNNEQTASDTSESIDIDKPVQRTQDTRLDDLLAPSECREITYLNASLQHAASSFAPYEFKLEMFSSGADISDIENIYSLRDANGAVLFQESSAKLKALVDRGTIYTHGLLSAGDRTNDQSICILYLLSPETCIRWLINSAAQYRGDPRVAARVATVDAVIRIWRNQVSSATDAPLRQVYQEYYYPTLKKLIDRYSRGQTPRLYVLGTDNQLPSEVAEEEFWQKQAPFPVVQLQNLASNNTAFLPFGTLACARDSASDLLALVWRGLAGEKRWFSLGYTNALFSVPFLLRLPQSNQERALYRNFRAIRQTLASEILDRDLQTKTLIDASQRGQVVADAMTGDLQRARTEIDILERLDTSIQYEMIYVHHGHTMWFEDAILHFKQQLFAQATVNAVDELLTAVRAQNTIAVSDYTTTYLPTIEVKVTGKSPRVQEVAVYAPSPDTMQNVFALDPRADVLWRKTDGKFGWQPFLSPTTAIGNVQLPGGTHSTYTRERIAFAQQFFKLTQKGTNATVDALLALSKSEYDDLLKKISDFNRASILNNGGLADATQRKPTSNPTPVEIVQKSPLEIVQKLDDATRKGVDTPLSRQTVLISRFIDAPSIADLWATIQLPSTSVKNLLRKNKGPWKVVQTIPGRVNFRQELKDSNEARQNEMLYELRQAIERALTEQLETEDRPGLPGRKARLTELNRFIQISADDLKLELQDPDTFNLQISRVLIRDLFSNVSLPASASGTSIVDAFVSLRELMSIGFRNMTRILRNAIERSAAAPSQEDIASLQRQSLAELLEDVFLRELFQEETLCEIFERAMQAMILVFDYQENPAPYVLQIFNQSTCAEVKLIEEIQNKGASLIRELDAIRRGAQTNLYTAKFLAINAKRIAEKFRTTPDPRKVFEVRRLLDKLISANKELQPELPLDEIYERYAYLREAIATAEDDVLQTKGLLIEINLEAESLLDEFNERFALLRKAIGIAQEKKIFSESYPLEDTLRKILLPAAIERARIQMYTQYVTSARIGQYRVAYRACTPQALRLDEIVREYCLYDRLPFAAEATCYEEYAALWNPSNNSVDRRDALAYSTLVPAPARSSDSIASEAQFYNVSTGIHHQTLFGCDLILSALWMRLMNFYLSLHERDNDAPKTIRDLYLNTLSNKKLRKLVIDIGARKKAVVRIKTLLRIIFAPFGSTLASIGASRYGTDATVGLPPLDEIRPIDLRAISLIVFGVDYSILRARRTDASIRLEKEVNDDDGNVIIDPQYVYRRALAAKEVLVDAYYRAVINKFFRRDDNRPSRLVYDDTKGSAKIRIDDKKTTTVREYFNSESIYATTQLLPGSELSPFTTVTGPVTRDISSYSKKKVVDVYEAEIRDKRFRLTVVDKPPPFETRVNNEHQEREAPFVSVGDIQKEQTLGGIARSFANTVGKGYNMVLRSTLAAILRRKFAENYDSRIIYEPAWHHIPRCALVAALFRLEIDLARDSMLDRVIAVLVRTIDNAGHLLYDDPESVEAQVAEAATAAVGTMALDIPALPQSTTVQPNAVSTASTDIAVARSRSDETSDDDIDDKTRPKRRRIIAAAEDDESQQMPSRTRLGVRARQSTTTRSSNLSLLEINRRLLRKAANNTDYSGWMRAIEARLGHYLFAPAVLRKGTKVQLQPDNVQPPTASQTLLAYESQRLYGGDDGYLSRFIYGTLLPLLQGRISSSSNLQTLLLRAEEWRSRVHAPPAPLDFQTARVRQDQIATARTAENRNTYNWAELLYGALQQHFDLQTRSQTAALLMQRYASVDETTALYLEQYYVALVSTAAPAVKPRALDLRDLQMFVPVMTLLRMILLDKNDTLLQNTQLHPLMPLLVAPTNGRPVLRFVSTTDARSQNYQTITRPTKSVYPSDASFTNEEIMASLGALPATQLDVLHEFIPLTREEVRERREFVVVSRVTFADANLTGVTALDMYLQTLRSTVAGQTDALSMIKY